jgi:hypothetical protein
MIMLSSQTYDQEKILYCLHESALLEKLQGVSKRHKPNCNKEQGLPLSSGTIKWTFTSTLFSKGGTTTQT